jgi:hypothetical protein
MKKRPVPRRITMEEALDLEVTYGVNEILSKMNGIIKGYDRLVIHQALRWGLAQLTSRILTERGDQGADGDEDKVAIMEKIDMALVKALGINTESRVGYIG